MSEDSADVLVRHFCDALRLVVERGDDGEDRGSGVGCELHVAQMDAIERCLANTEDERTALLEGDVGGAMDEVGGEAIGDCCESSHGAGKDDHGGSRVAAAGDAGSDVGVGVLVNFG